MTCKHCGQLVSACYDGQCNGWAKTAEGCRGYAHQDLFHGCADGKHQAEAAVPVTAEGPPTPDYPPGPDQVHSDSWYETGPGEGYEFDRDGNPQ